MNEALDLQKLDDLLTRRGEQDGKNKWILLSVLGITLLSVTAALFYAFPVLNRVTHSHKEVTVMKL